MRLATLSVLTLSVLLAACGEEPDLLALKTGQQRLFFSACGKAFGR